MNPVSVLTDLFVIYIVGLFAWLCWCDLRDRRQARALAGWEQQALEIANDACSDPPCCDEEWWICDAHLPKGKHHPPPLRYGPEPIVGRCQWSDEMEERFAE